MYRREDFMKSKLFTKRSVIPVFLILVILLGTCLVVRKSIIIPKLDKEKHDKAYSTKLSKDGLNLISFEDDEQGNKIAVLSSFQGGFYGLDVSEPFSEYYGCSLSQIDELAYDECFGLRKIIIPNSVKKISKGAFYRCNSLEKLYIPKSVESISNAAFSETNDFTMYVEKNSYAERYANKNNIKCKYYISDSNKKDTGKYPEVVDNKEYKDYYYSVYYYDGNPEATIIGAYTGTEEKNVKIPAEFKGIPVKSISAEGYESCENVETITLPKTIRSVGRGAFCLCTSLKKVYFTENVKIIGRDLFDSIEHSVTICAPENSYAHKYAVENNIKFECVN